MDKRVVNSMNNELWRTIIEPDIDPILAEALRSNQSFGIWFVRQILPAVELDSFVIVKPNYTREEQSWLFQSKPRRETDLHIVFKDSCGDQYALLVENKVVAPPSLHQQQDYAAYAKWGQDVGKWRKAVTVIMAPRGYLDQKPSSNAYDVRICYETICDAARRHSLMRLTGHLSAALKWHSNSGITPRNPDALMGRFWDQYTELLREEDRRLYESLSGKDRRQLDKSQSWFEFWPKNPLLGKDSAGVIHKVCNHRARDQDPSKPQFLAIHVPRTGSGRPPEWGNSDQWRASKQFWIHDIQLEKSDWMFFADQDFDSDAARRVWTKAADLIFRT